MAKWKLLIYIMMAWGFALSVTAASTEVHCQLSTDNGTTDAWQDINLTKWGGSVSDSEQIATIPTLASSTDYYFRCRNSTTSWYYLEQRTEAGDEFSMASLAITLFVTAITSAVLYMALSPKVLFYRGGNYSEFGNFVVKRCILVVGLFLLSLDTAMVATIADTANLDLTSELFRYMWLINWTAYFLILYIAYTTIIRAMALWNSAEKRKRMGDEGEEYYA